MELCIPFGNGPMGKFTGSGNRIKHNPKCLVTYTRNLDFKSPPPILCKVQDRINDLARRPRACPAVFFHGKEDPAIRSQERSEGRERDALYLCSLIDHMDLVTMRVGVPQEGGDLTRYSVEDLMEGTGMVNPGRFHRASARMNAKGYVPIKHRHQDGKDGVKEGAYSSRVVTMLLITVLGMEQEFSHERDLESQRRRNGGLTNEELAAERGMMSRPVKPAKMSAVERRYVERGGDLHKIRGPP